MPDSLHEVEQRLYERLRRDRLLSPNPKPPLTAQEQWEKELEEVWHWSETMRPKPRTWREFFRTIVPWKI